MRRALLVSATALLAGCAQPLRYGMVEDRSTGVMLGSVIERNLVIDSSQLVDKNVKLNLRNVSGDPSYDLSIYRTKILESLGRKGFISSEADNFGIKYDVNVLYSGQIRQDLTKEFAFLGAGVGGVASYGGSHRTRNLAGGLIGGATLGAVIGSHLQDDTYIVIAEISVAIADQYRGETKKTIVFSSSPPLQEAPRSSIKPFEAILQTRLAVYGGGRNVSAGEVAIRVRERLALIAADAI